MIKTLDGTMVDRFKITVYSVSMGVDSRACVFQIACSIPGVTADKCWQPSTSTKKLQGSTATDCLEALCTRICSSSKCYAAFCQRSTKQPTAKRQLYSRQYNKLCSQLEELEGENWLQRLSQLVTAASSLVTDATAGA